MAHDLLTSRSKLIRSFPSMSLLNIKKKNRDGMRRWRSAHPEQSRANTRRSVAKFRREHPNRAKAINKKHYHKYRKLKIAKALAWRKKNWSWFKKIHKAGVHRRWLMRYGITPEQYKVLLKKQNNRCALCGKKPHGRRLSVDHCHKENRVRGLLCVKCNSAIELVAANPFWADRAKAYLRY